MGRKGACPVCKAECVVFEEERGRLLGVKWKFHRGRACECRTAEIVVIYLNICFCMACCFGSPEDMQRERDVADRWSGGAGGRGLAEPLRPRSAPPSSSSSLSSSSSSPSTHVVLDLSRLPESLMK